MLLPDAVIWEIEEGPPVEATRFLGDLARKAVMAQAGGGAVPWVLRGHGDASPVHDHAFFLPEDADGDHRLDRILITARLGFDREAALALTSVTRLYAATPDLGGTIRRDEWAVRCHYLGSLAGAPSRLAAVSYVWRSVSPFVAALEASNVKKAVRRECEMRFLPKPMTVVDLAPDGSAADADGVRCSPAGHWLRLTFGCRMAGPLALGDDCHFGLGLFAPDLE
ncbi:MAG: hypothetical protein GC191_08260 [Azospirillum sp.]|nr:hypothetical protein [Azospirillum sp.]